MGRIPRVRGSRTAVAGLRDQDFGQPSGCTGRRVRDLVCHLIARLPDVAGSPAEALSRSRAMLEEIARAAFPRSFSEGDALLTGTGRRTPTAAERPELGSPAAKLPLVLG